MFLKKYLFYVNSNKKIAILILASVLPQQAFARGSAKPSFSKPASVSNTSEEELKGPKKTPLSKLNACFVKSNFVDSFDALDPMIVTEAEKACRNTGLQSSDLSNQSDEECKVSSKTIAEHKMKTALILSPLKRTYDSSSTSSLRTSECLFQESLKSLSRIWEAQPFLTMSLSDYKLKRKSLYQLFGSLSDKSEEPLCKDFLEETKKTVKKLDPGRLGPAEQIYNKAMSLMINPSSKDIRDVAFFEDLYFDSQVQVKINDFIEKNLMDKKSKTKRNTEALIYLRDLTYRGKRLKNLNEVSASLQKKLVAVATSKTMRAEWEEKKKLAQQMAKKAVLEAGRIEAKRQVKRAVQAVRNGPYNTLARRRTATKLARKTVLDETEKRALKAAEEAGVAFEKTNVQEDSVISSKVLPYFTPEEIWLYEQLEFEDYLYSDSINRILFQLEKNKRFSTVSDRLKNLKNDFFEGDEIIDEFRSKNWQTGDIVLQQMTPMYEIKGRPLPTELRLQKLATRSDSYHAGFIAKDSEGAVHLVDSLDVDEHQEKKKGLNKKKDKNNNILSGIFMNPESLAKDYSSIGYRFDLGKLIDPENKALAKVLENQPPSLHDQFLRETAEKYAKDRGEEYYTQLQSDFLPPEDSKATSRYKIKNSAKRRTRSAFLPAKEVWSNQDILAKVQMARQEGKSSEEICSEFAVIESVRYLKFLEDKLQKALKIQGKIFNIPWSDTTRLSGTDTGTLSRTLQDWVAAKKVTVIRPQKGLFQEAGERH